MDDVRMYADVAKVLQAWAKESLACANVCTELPPNLYGVVKDGPVHVVERLGGADEVPGLDVARVVWDTYGVGRDGTQQAAERIRRAVRMSLPGRTFSGCTFSETKTISAPRKFDYRDRQIYFFSATYQLKVHCPI